MVCLVVVEIRSIAVVVMVEVSVECGLAVQVIGDKRIRSIMNQHVGDGIFCLHKGEMSIGCFMRNTSSGLDRDEKRSLGQVSLCSGCVGYLNGRTKAST